MPKKVAYPTADVTLRPWGSRVFWTKLLGKDVPVRCGQCLRTRQIPAYQANLERFTGLHKGCRHNLLRLRGKVDLPGGAIFDFDVRGPENGSPKRGLLTWACGHQALAIYRYRWKAEEKAPRCTVCHPPKLTGWTTLPKGSRVNFSKAARQVVKHRTGHYYKVPMECRGCYKETGVLKYVQVTVVSRYRRGKSHWNELCGECFAERDDPKLVKEQRMADSRTVTDFSRENEKGEVPVVYALCRCERWVSRRDGITHWKKRPERCRECQRDPAKFAERLLAQAQNSNGQKNGGDDFLLRVEQVIEDLWSGVRSLNIPYEKRLRWIGEKEIAEKLSIGSPGSTTSGDQLRRKLRDLGVRDKFLDKKHWVPAYVRSVVERAEKQIRQNAV